MKGTARKLSGMKGRSRDRARRREQEGRGHGKEDKKGGGKVKMTRKEGAR